MRAKAPPQRQVKRAKNHGYDHHGKNGMRQKYGEVYGSHDRRANKRGAPMVKVINDIGSQKKRGGYNRRCHAGNVQSHTSAPDKAKSKPKQYCTRGVQAGV